MLVVNEIKTIKDAENGNYTHEKFYCLKIERHLWVFVQDHVFYAAGFEWPMEGLETENLQNLIIFFF